MPTLTTATPTSHSIGTSNSLFKRACAQQQTKNQSGSAEAATKKQQSAATSKAQATQAKQTSARNTNAHTHAHGRPLLAHAFGRSGHLSSDRESFDSDPGLSFNAFARPPLSHGGPSLQHEPSPLQPCRSTPTMSRRARLPSLNRSCESTDSSTNSSSGASSDLSAGKSNYRIMLLGAKKTGKTSIIRQFLYDKFNPQYRETVDDMYRGEFEIHGQSVGFDIQDVSGGYVYEFPGMRDVSIASADAFLVVFSLDDASSWEEAARLRDLVHETKDAEVPIVVVGNKCDLDLDPELAGSKDALEATAVFDWENGYVECSAKERRNINKIFKELLQQAKSKYDFTVPQMSTATTLVNASTARGNIHHTMVSGAGNQHPRRVLEDNLKRRQSLPAVPAGMALAAGHPAGQPTGQHAAGHQGPLATLMSRMHSSHRSVDSSHRSVDSAHSSGGSTPVHQGMPGAGGGIGYSPKSSTKRRSSLAALRRDSCKIS